MSRRPHLQTQFKIFVLFGDIINPRGGQVWTASLLQLLEVLGVTERAARSTLSRMRRNGWLKAARSGRHSLYALTAKGRRLVDEGGHRIFEPHQWQWDHKWHVVVYSLPEDKRKLRNDLRKRLTWLGFGRLAPGTWVSPHDRQDEVAGLLDDLDAHRYVQMFCGMHSSYGEDAQIVEQCWDIKGINQQYGKFIARWEPEYEQCVQDLVRGNGPPQAECFAQRFWITHDYSPFPRLDPNLPVELLPEGWLGERAVEVFDEYRSLLSERASEFIDVTLRAPNGNRFPSA